MYQEQNWERDPATLFLGTDMSFQFKQRKNGGREEEVCMIGLSGQGVVWLTVASILVMRGSLRS